MVTIKAGFPQIFFYPCRDRHFLLDTAEIEASNCQRRSYMPSGSKLNKSITLRQYQLVFLNILDRNELYKCHVSCFLRSGNYTFIYS